MCKCQQQRQKKTHANSPFYLVCYLVVFLLVRGADFPLVTLRAGAFFGLGAACVPTARVFVSLGDRYCTWVWCYGLRRGQAGRPTPLRLGGEAAAAAAALRCLRSSGVGVAGCNRQAGARQSFGGRGTPHQTPDSPPTRIVRDKCNAHAFRIFFLTFSICIPQAQDHYSLPMDSSPIGVGLGINCASKMENWKGPLRCPPLPQMCTGNWKEGSV